MVDVNAKFNPFRARVSLWFSFFDAAQLHINSPGRGLHDVHKSDAAAATAPDALCLFPFCKWAGDEWR